MLDSRGCWTVEVKVETVGSYGRYSAPSGASVGIHEVPAFPRGGIDEALKLVKELIEPKLVGMDASDQRGIDHLLKEIDGTSNFSKIGGSIAIACSIASAKAAASSLSMPLYAWLGGVMATRMPIPLGNVLGGGRHVAVRTLDLQELLVFPLDAPSISLALKINVEVHRRLPKHIAKYDPTFSGGRNDEGAWVARLDVREALSLVREVCDKVEGELGHKVGLGLDVASSQLWDASKNLYCYVSEGVKRTPEEQLTFIQSLIKDFNILYVEDPFQEDDFENFSKLTKLVKPCLVCGDDLFATNIERLKKGLRFRAANAIIIKPNQVGTLTDVFETISLARSEGLKTIASHRSGETEDEALAHIAVGFSTEFIKTGVVGGERIAKLNELIRIEEEASSTSMMQFL